MTIFIVLIRFGLLCRHSEKVNKQLAHYGVIFTRLCNLKNDPVGNSQLEAGQNTPDTLLHKMNSYCIIITSITTRIKIELIA